MARTNEKNQAEREHRTTELMAQLEAGVTAIQTGDDFKRYLSVAAKFHAYSHNNVLLIWTNVVCQALRTGTPWIWG